MAQGLSGRAAFLFGFTVGRRTRRYWSAREALNAYPGLSYGNVDSFLNGADDGARGDSWRYDQVRKIEAGQFTLAA